MVDELVTFAKTNWATITAVCGWSVTAYKWLSDRHKLRLEVRKLVGEQLEKLHACDTAHREADKQFAECNDAFFRAFRQNPIDLVQFEDARTKVCSALSDLIHRYIIYLDFYCHVYQDDSARLVTILDNTIRDVRIWARCQGNINHDVILSQFPTKPEPFQISKHTVAPIRHTLSALRLRNADKDALNRELDLLLNAGLALAYVPAQSKDCADQSA
jgi:hypothetical protein